MIADVEPGWYIGHPQMKSITSIKERTYFQTQYAKGHLLQAKCIDFIFSSFDPTDYKVVRSNSLDDDLGFDDQMRLPNVSWPYDHFGVSATFRV